MCLQRGRPISKWTAHDKQTWYEGLVTFSIRCADAAWVDTRHQTTDDRKRRLAKSADQLHSRPSPLPHPYAWDTALVLLWRRDARHEARCSPWAVLLWMHQLLHTRIGIRPCTRQILRSFDVCRSYRSPNRPTIKNFWRYVYSFWKNVRMWQTPHDGKGHTWC